MENKEIHITPEIHINHEEIEIIGINTICRFCASQNERLIGVYSEEGISNDLATKINLYLPIKVNVNDELPLQCCWSCASTILAWHELVLTCVESDRKFRNSSFITEKQILGSAGYDNSVGAPSEENDGYKDPVVKSEDDLPVLPPDLSDEDDKKAPTIAKATKLETCDICDKTFAKTCDLKRHNSRHHTARDFDRFANLSTKTCTACCKTFPTRTLLKKHVQDAHNVKQKRHRRKNDEIEAHFFCDVCEKGFTRKYDMEKHKMRIHGDEQKSCDSARKTNMELLNKCRRRDSDGKAFYECDFCERVFAQSYNLMRHRTIHTGVKAFFCHICGKSFRMSNGLTRHIDTFHHGVRNFRCEVCGKCFTARATRDEHMNIHTNNRPFVCDVCGKCFKQKASLHVHKIFHTDMYRFQCNTCEKKFRRAQDLKVHSWLHTGHRPYSCPQCKAAFRLGHDLKRHLRVHEKVNECVCNECGSIFSQERYLKVHKKIHRKNISIKLEDPLT